MKRAIAVCSIPLLLLAAAGCGETKPPVAAGPQASYAIYADYARGSNKLMKNGLNRRLFNVVETQAGSDIKLGSDGSISLEPGTYRITGFSLVTMQATMAPPKMQNNTNYPGYAIVYPKAFEADSTVLSHLIALGSPQTALDLAPSVFDVVYTASTKTEIALGHQAGNELHSEVYMSVYEVDGIKSEYHLFARIAITKL
jgi:hypothetical protein